MGLASRRTRTIGVLLNDLHNPFFAEIMDGIFEAAEELEYRLLIGSGRRQAAGERRAVDVFLEHRADGLVLVSPRLPSADIVGVGRMTPTVVVGRPVRVGYIDSVTNDDLAGGKLAVRHLAELGHRGSRTSTGAGVPVRTHAGPATCVR